jgi:hypothetical protein
MYGVRLNVLVQNLVSLHCVRLECLMSGYLLSLQSQDEALVRV